MPKKNSHRFKGAPQRSFRRPIEILPVLFTLPEDTQLVHGAAFISAMESAFQTKKQHLDLGTEAVEAGAIEAALLWEKAQVDGKQGTDDPVLFRTTFVQFFMRIHPAMMTLLEAKPFVFTVLDRLTDEKRGARLEAFAAKHVAYVEQIPLDEPIVIEWD